ncbi:MerR family transcriptional regulator [Deinococcus pimensis]|uniref:MerR family transcriptional regulator n=1 Tax=Deinococcus pimensis TaxID=309888 RepID=UPI0004B98955|nr:MerR family transcriptional regulator [Deinococcus pimensis]
MEKLRIGQVSTATGVSVRAIRHYDQLGLLSATREDNRYRVFHATDVDRVRLIQLFLSVGFTLDEIGRWAPCFQDDPTSSGATVEDLRAFYTRKIADVTNRIDAMTLLRGKLTAQLRALDERAGQGEDALLLPHF